MSGGLGYSGAGDGVARILASARGHCGVRVGAKSRPVGPMPAAAKQERKRTMARIEQSLAAMGLALPPPLKPPPGVLLPFRFVRVVGRRALVSGHGPHADDGRVAPPLGKLGRELTVEQGYEAARRVALSMLGSLQRELGSLDRVQAWARVFGMVNSAPGFNRQPAVINGFSDLILDLWGPEAGAHARSAVGMAELPFDIPVEIEAEVEIGD
jgi:enamine deaminase RidA (YjgF/YER057c/UK114 family)